MMKTFRKYPRKMRQMNPQTKKWKLIAQKIIKATKKIRNQIKKTLYQKIEILKIRIKIIKKISNKQNKIFNSSSQVQQMI